MSENKPGSLRVIHALPGRLRLRLESPVEEETALVTWEQRLKEIPGVQAVSVNRTTRSLLVQYDSSRFDPTGQLGISIHPVPTRKAPARQTRMLGELRRVPPTPAAQTIYRTFWQTDARLLEWSGGLFDLKLAIPAVLLGLGVWELIIGSELAAITFPTLAWYSYNVFIHFHPPDVTVPFLDESANGPPTAAQ